MATMPEPPACRSCVYWLSAPEVPSEGICSNSASPANLTWTHETDCCSEHDGNQTGALEGHYLYLRRCVRCERVNIYSAGYGGDAWCARCD